MTDTARPLPTGPMPTGPVAGSGFPAPLPAALPGSATPHDAAVVAPYGRRLAAGFLDALVALVGGGVLAAAALADVPGAAVLGAVVLGVAVAVVQWALHGRRGWTVGRLALRIRTVDEHTHRPIGMARVLVRGLVVAAGGLVLAVGALVVLLSPLLDRTGRLRGWHDRAARDVVLRAPVGSARSGGELFGPAFDRSPLPYSGARDAARDDTAAAVAVSEVAAGWPWHEAAPAELPLRPWAAPKSYELPAVTGSLRLAPLAPQRSGPDLDTRAMPLLRPADLAPAPAAPVPAAPAPAQLAPDLSAPEQPDPGIVATGLDPELELTHRAPLRPDVVDDVTLPLTGPETAEIELSDGRRLLVERTALVGRNPVARTDVRTIRVHDPNRSVSKTHLQIGVEPSGVWVADRGSTNGTVVTLPDGGQVLCGVDQRVRLRVGATVVFGDCALRLVRGPGSPPVP